MVINLTVQEVREAIANHLNNSGVFNKQLYEVKPEHVELTTHREGEYEESCEVFDGFRINLDNAKKEG